MGHSDDPMEWEDGTVEGDRPDHHIRRVKPGMGSVMSGHHHRWPLVASGKEMAHKLPAATLALKTFVKDKMGVSVLLRIDNTTAVAYINNHGGTVSKQLVSLTRDLWMWCLIHNRVLNYMADLESRSMIDRSDWKMCPETMAHWKWTCLRPDYFSWRPYPYAEATDAFLQDWTAVKGFANPPWNLISRVLTKHADTGSRCGPGSSSMEHGIPSYCQCWWTSHASYPKN